MARNREKNNDLLNEGREERFMDIDRMVNDGLGGGNVTRDNGLIEDTTTDTMDDEFDEEFADEINDEINDECEDC